MYFTVGLLIKMESAKSKTEERLSFWFVLQHWTSTEAISLANTQRRNYFCKQSPSHDVRQCARTHVRVQSLHILLYLHCSILWPTLNGFHALTAKQAGSNDTAQRADISLSFREQCKTRATALLFAILEQHCTPASVQTPLGNVSWILRHHKKA